MRRIKNNERNYNRQRQLGTHHGLDEWQHIAGGENVTLSNINIKNCHLIAESGEYPIPFADRANRLDDFSMSEAAEGNKLHASHTCELDSKGVCTLCGELL